MHQIQMFFYLLILKDGPGLYDPCEKEPTDLANKLTDQQREDITKYSQV